MVSQTIRAALAALAIVAPLSGAMATTITVDAPVTSGCSLENFQVSIACAAGFPVTNNGGNVEAGDLNGLFSVNGTALTGWTQIDRIGSVGKDATSISGGSNRFAINRTAEAGSDWDEGTWSLISPFAFDPKMFYVFALKGATMQVAYLMDSTIMTGGWTNDDLGYSHTPGNGNGNGNKPKTPVWKVPGLSNITLFSLPGRPHDPGNDGGDDTGGGGEHPSPVPLPAAVWLLLGGLGALAGLRRRSHA